MENESLSSSTTKIAPNPEITSEVSSTNLQIEATATPEVDAVEKNQELSGVVRNPDGTYPPGVSGNIEGPPPMTEEQKLARKAKKEALEAIKEKYIEELTNLLPEIHPQLVTLIQGGNMQAIKETHDRVFGKATLPIKHTGEVDVNVKKLETIIDDILSVGVEEK